MAPLPLTGRDLTIGDVVAVARERRSIELDPGAVERMRASRAVIERLVAEGAPVYGVTTGFGDLADVRIDPAQTADLQRNLVRSHAAGVGEPLPEEVVRAMLLLRANTLAVGLSGVRVEPLALALDYAAMALTELASISERRSARVVDAHLSGLPPFLARRPGLESGLMIAQYSAAALVNELQTLAHPASVDTIPTSANQEDHVSMGATAALKLREVVDRAEAVLAIEALCAAEGIDHRAPLRPGRGV